MTINNLAPRALCLAGLLTLAGCHHHDGKSEDQRVAVGQVLPGSISDAMLPYDTRRSQPQLAPVHAAADAGPAASADTSADATSGAGDAAPGLDSDVKAPPGH